MLQKCVGHFSIPCCEGGCWSGAPCCFFAWASPSGTFSREVRRAFLMVRPFPAIVEPDDIVAGGLTWAITQNLWFYREVPPIFHTGASSCAVKCSQASGSLAYFELRFLPEKQWSSWCVCQLLFFIWFLRPDSLLSAVYGVALPGTPTPKTPILDYFSCTFRENIMDLILSNWISEKGVLCNILIFLRTLARAAF